MSSPTSKWGAFVALHQRAGAFIIPNPWDLGSAGMLAGLGFQALATTSAGLANVMGRVDGAVTVDEKLEHCAQMCAYSPLPINADLENCYFDDPGKAATTITRGAEVGLAGGSIEDYSPADGGRIYSMEHSVERVHAAVEAARAVGRPFLLTARAENLIRGVKDLDDTIARLQAFEKAGADVLYAPGLRTLEQVSEVASAVSKPLNVLASPFRGVTLEELGRHGAKRISVGGALARAATAALLRAGREMQEHGTFEWTGDLASNADVEKLLS